LFAGSRYLRVGFNFHALSINIERGRTFRTFYVQYSDNDYVTCQLHVCVLDTLSLRFHRPGIKFGHENKIKIKICLSLA